MHVRIQASAGKSPLATASRRTRRSGSIPCITSLRAPMTLRWPLCLTLFFCSPAPRCVCVRSLGTRGAGGGKVGGRRRTLLIIFVLVLVGSLTSSFSLSFSVSSSVSSSVSLPFAFNWTSCLFSGTTTERGLVGDRALAGSVVERVGHDRRSGVVAAASGGPAIR